MVNLRFVRESAFIIGMISLILVAAYGAAFAAIFLVSVSVLLICSMDSIKPALTRCWPLFLLPLLFVTSTAWSNSPIITLKSSFQFLITIAFAAIAATSIQPRRLLFILLTAYTLVAIFSLFFIYQTLSGRALQGPFASKNVLARIGSCGVLLGASLCFLKGTNLGSRLVCASCATVSMIALVLAQSAGALVFTAIGLVTVFVAFSFSQARSLSRGLMLAVSSVCVLAAGVLMKTIQAFVERFVVDGLQKDLTMTGRTEIWDIANKVISVKPFFGSGYNAFWTPENPDAVRIWAMFNIRNQSGFNFHNEFYEILVNAGLFGLTAFGIVLLYLGWRIFLQILDRNYITCILLGVVTSFIVSFFVESSVNYPFSSSTATFWVVAGLLFNTRLLGPRRVVPKGE